MEGVEVETIRLEEVTKSERDYRWRSSQGLGRARSFSSRINASSCLAVGIYYSDLLRPSHVVEA